VSNLQQFWKQSKANSTQHKANFQQAEEAAGTIHTEFADEASHLSLPDLATHNY